MWGVENKQSTFFRRKSTLRARCCRYMTLNYVALSHICTPTTMFAAGTKRNASGVSVCHTTGLFVRRLGASIWYSIAQYAVDTRLLLLYIIHLKCTTKVELRLIIDNMCASQVRLSGKSRHSVTRCPYYTCPHRVPHGSVSGQPPQGPNIPICPVELITDKNRAIDLLGEGFSTDIHKTSKSFLRTIALHFCSDTLEFTRELLIVHLEHKHAALCDRQRQQRDGAFEHYSTLVKQRNDFPMDNALVGAFLTIKCRIGPPYFFHYSGRGGGRILVYVVVASYGQYLTCIGITQLAACALLAQTQCHRREGFEDINYGESASRELRLRVAKYAQFFNRNQKNGVAEENRRAVYAIIRFERYADGYYAVATTPFEVAKVHQMAVSVHFNNVKRNFIMYDSKQWERAKRGLQSRNDYADYCVPADVVFAHQKNWHWFMSTRPDSIA